MANNRLLRDKEHAMLGGVCAGIANRFSLDPTLVRVAAIALGILTAAVPLVVIYVALWIIMPAGDAAPHRPSRDELTEEIREAADRVREAAQIVTTAAKQAADEISHLQDRHQGSTPESTTTLDTGTVPASPDAPPVAPSDPTSTPSQPSPESLTDEQRRQQDG